MLSAGQLVVLTLSLNVCAIASAEPPTINDAMYSNAQADTGDTELDYINGVLNEIIIAYQKEAQPNLKKQTSIAANERISPTTLMPTS